jgi:hypothetical protein
MRPYTKQEFETLQNTANEVAHALAMNAQNGHQ